jgi:DNA-binding CsgD family transcriptional regulator
VNGDGFSDAEIESYRRIFPSDHGTRLVHSMGWEVWSHSQIVYRNPGVFYDTPIYHEYYKPMGLEDGVGYVLHWPKEDGFTLLKVHHSIFGTAGFGERGVTLLTLLLPAFQAGFHALFRTATQRHQLSAMMDTLPIGLRVLDAKFASLHDNPSLREILAAEPERSHLESVIADTSRAAGAAQSKEWIRMFTEGRGPAQQVWMRQAGYQVTSTVLPNDLFGPQASILTSVARITPAMATAEEMSDRFNLTRQEGRVATLLADGSSNATIAKNLGISEHTARRHTERVLAKLGVHSRTAVRGTLERQLVNRRH